MYKSYDTGNARTSMSFTVVFLRTLCSQEIYKDVEQVSKYQIRSTTQIKNSRPSVQIKKETWSLLKRVIDKEKLEEMKEKSTCNTSISHTHFFLFLCACIIAFRHYHEDNYIWLFYECVPVPRAHLSNIRLPSHWSWCSDSLITDCLVSRSSHAVRNRNTTTSSR